MTHSMILPTTMRWRYLWRGLGLSIALLFTLQMWCAWQVYDYSRLPKTLPEHADAAVILGAAGWDKRPSPVFRERINHALVLYQSGRVDKLIFTGSSKKSGFMTEAEIGRKFALKQGVTEHDIFFETHSKDTFQNLANTRFLMQKHHLHSVIIVTDPYHMARAMAIARHFGMHAYSSPTPTSRFTNTQFFIHESYTLFVYYLLHTTHKIWAAFT